MTATIATKKIVEPISAAVEYVTVPKPRKSGGQYRSIRFATANGAIWKSFSLPECEAIAAAKLVQLIPYWTLEGKRQPRYVEHHQILLA